MTSETAKTAAPRKWDQVLSKVRGMLDETLARADGRLEELDQLASGPQNDRLSRNLKGLEERLQRAGTLVEQTDQSLADGEKAVRDYMSNVEGLRQKLTDWAEQ